jgi:hypothetical protein
MFRWLQGYSVHGFCSLRYSDNKTVAVRRDYGGGHSLSRDVGSGASILVGA